MPNYQVLVALSREPIAEKLIFSLKDQVLKLGISLHSNGGQISNGSYYSERFEASAHLDTTQREQLRTIAASFNIDLCFLRPDLLPQDICVLAMDMDSTLINIECIDEIADFTGKKSTVAEITEATMRGEIKDFKESLRRRVALLEGVHANALESVYRERLRPNPGAVELLAGAHERGLYTLLVSGGFTFFTEKLREQLGFKQTQANTLEIIDGKLTGKVLGDIVDGAAKAAHLDEACARLGCTKANAITMGDGANDLMMMNGSGISVAYKAKPVVKEKADAAFDRVGLDAALLLIS
ncbi:MULTISPECIES: phosphoserine phosphatase SerB [unclassified Polynucleobacter]|uniref:phosphoserine phosphatase SerB n=1 Tax=unclassified Polynucleobacter TaxID=2640945 RepID=UPI001C0AB5DA|nr:MULTISPECIES: phosphoserine phosphatase SerB [unclassified Polynucleobacter]MBU3603168.1 phosphoserine phosphatase SerB [Polynucleobacter sp. AP-Kaivos-20-H2]MBU3618846.1 phosphoserine phosphatase SerB [Polynucleobacter sp. JS-Fieb-80-E5]